MPPRHGKSEYISHYLPIWYALKYPSSRIILTGYSQSFVNSFGKRIIDFFAEYGSAQSASEVDNQTNLLGCDTTIRPKRRSASEIELTNGSRIKCSGAGGSLTGHGADLLIIDDPIKSHTEALSANRRDSIDDWFGSTAYSRLEPGGNCIIVMTRWHRSDLVGRIVEDEERSQTFHYISLPAFSLGTDGESPDQLGREAGEPLWPERIPIKALEQRRRILGSFWFSALYQQQPTRKGDQPLSISDFGIFMETDDLLMLYPNDGEPKTVVKAFCRKIMTMDLAVSGKEGADYTVIMTAYVTPDKQLVISDIRRKRGKSISNMDLLLTETETQKPDDIGIECVAYQEDFFDTAAKKGLPVTKLQAKGDKMVRAYAFQPLLEGGRVYLPKKAPWLEAFKKEVDEFPTSKHDDQVDCLTYLRQLLHHSTYKPVSGKRE
ncbi:MAG: phage terminase large subunit [Candidatus Kapaibacteriales bacterium]